MAPNASVIVEGEELSFIVGGSANSTVQTVQPLWKTVWQSFVKPDTHSPYDPVIALLGIHLNELKTYFHTKPAHI